MAIKGKQHKSTLKSFFLRFLFSVAISVVAVIMIYVVCMGVGLYHGLLLPANAFSNIVNEYEHTLQAGGTIDLDKVPEEISYAVFDTDGNVQRTTMSARQLIEVKDMIQDNSVTKILSPYNIQRQFQVIRTEHKTYVFEYYITAEFASPILRKMFPHVEWTLVIFLIILILADVLVMSLLFASKLSKKVNYMKQATDYIKARKLDFIVHDTGIKEFDSVMSSLNELKDNLSESLSNQWQLQQQKKEQMGALAHDIKTPLTVIRGNTDLLLETKLSEEQKEYLLYISNNVSRIQEYVKNLIEISKGKLENGKMQQVDVSKFIEDTQEQFLPLLKCKNLKLESHHSIGLQKIDIDPVFCTRALMNFMDNAVYYSPEGGTVYFNTWDELEYHCFSIEDEGNGFSNEDLKNATTEFYRANQNRNMDGHYGMGLSIAKQIAQMHNGNLLLENGQHGAKVTLKIK